MQKVEVNGGELLLFLKDEFYAKWASEWENRLALQNVVLSYVEVPMDFRLEIRGISCTDPERQLKQEKMLRRYRGDENGIK